jgi:hypothetical protein
MRRSRFYAILLSSALLLTACAVSSERFYSNRGSLGAVSLCRTHQTAIRNGQYQLAKDVEQELRARLKKNLSQCEEIISASNRAVAAGVLATAVVVAAASSKGGGGGSGTTSKTTSSATDYDWDWDQFYNQYGDLIWRCRGVQSGQFAEDYHCAADYKSDTRWPSKSAQIQ